MTEKNSQIQAGSSVGKNLIRVGAWERLAGQARFCADIKMEGMAHVVVVRSSKHHALIKSINLDKARNSRGCLGI
ncbi:MAG: hypothetical protein PHS86_14705, partial [Syntrophaceae bacterium]|nr:hypothetical protein [Syntrophaceae bacterium]